MRFIFNPDAEEFIPKAEEEHRHSGQRFGYSVERGEAGLAWVSKYPDREDESVGVGVGWDGWTEPSEIKACTGPGNGAPISR